MFMKVEISIFKLLGHDKSTLNYIVLYTGNSFEKHTAFMCGKVWKQ